jgi:hypothetical protein
MAVKDFESLKRPATKDEIAAQLAHDAIDELQALRTGREDQLHTSQEQEILSRLAVLMVGPRKHAVLPVVRERYPQMAQLLDRQLGMVEHGAIRGISGQVYRYLSEGEVFTEGTRVTFLPTDDGMARNIQVVED